MKKTRLIVPMLSAVLATSAVGTTAMAQDDMQTIILDTDMVELFDDGMAMLMLERAPNIDLLGVTVLSGNSPMPKGLATGARQLGAMRSDTPIYAGSRHGIRNWRFDPEILAAEAVISLVVSWPGYPGHYDETIGGDPMADWVRDRRGLAGTATQAMASA